MNKKGFILCGIISIIMVVGCIFIIRNTNLKNEEAKLVKNEGTNTIKKEKTNRVKNEARNTIKDETISKENYNKNNITIKTHNLAEYYIINDDYKGRYDLQYVDFSETSKGSSNINVKPSDIVDFDNKMVVNYQEYVEFCKKWNLEQKYSSADENYIIYSETAFLPSGYQNARLADVSFYNDSVDLYIYSIHGRSIGLSGFVFIIPSEKNISNINVKYVITNSEFEELGPESETQVTID